MKLIILKNNLLEALNSVEKAIGDNVNLPILKNFFLEANEKIILSSTNLELAIKHSISGKILEIGAITLPFMVFKNIILNLNSERITLEQKEKQLIINAENYEAVLQGQNHKEFPIIPGIQNINQSLKINAGDFKEALSQVIIASQYSDIRPEISGVFLNYDEFFLTLVATDSFRLAERKIESQKINSTTGKFSVILPLKTASEILKIINNIEQEIEIFIDPNQIVFKTESQEIISRLIDGNFPDYQIIIPKEIKTEMNINRQELLNAIKLTSAFAGRVNDVTLKIGDNKKFLEVYSSDTALGENIYRIPIKHKGDNFSIVFNWRYLFDGIKILKGEEVILGVNTSDKPVLVKNLSEPNLIYIVMPLKA